MCRRPKEAFRHRFVKKKKKISNLQELFITQRPLEWSHLNQRSADVKGNEMMKRAPTLRMNRKSSDAPVIHLFNSLHIRK